MVGRVGPSDLELTEVHRFPNEPVRLPDGLHWDILRLYREVLPEHVAAAVFALTGGDLSQTTGLHIPVDAGVAAAFLR